MKNLKKKAILDFVRDNIVVSSGEVFEGVNIDISLATIKRLLTQLINEELIISSGAGKGTKYKISPAFSLFYPIDVEQYFQKEIDERKIIEQFNLSLINDVIGNVNLFNEVELKKLSELQSKFNTNISYLSETEYKKEMERLAIDLSWKSSQIEGNTYSLLETERLLKERETAEGKTWEDAQMLLNHKDALDFISEETDYLTPITISAIEDIHSLLVKDLGVDKNIRKRKVGISGTNYQPLDNEYQIKESLVAMCDLINLKGSVFEKSFLALVLLSYIQAFADGNKRTARIVSNAILMSNGYCPLSFRTVDSIDYKKAMLIFYEQNSIIAIKDIFINQFEFAVNTYF